MIWTAPVWLTILFALLLWFFQNVQHEGAHALVVRLAGGQIVRFRPWPHRHEGRFYFASVGYRIHELPPSLEGLVNAAPLLWNTLALLIMGILMQEIEPVGWVASMMLGWGICNAVDGTYNLATFLRREPKPGVDGW